MMMAMDVVQHLAPPLREASFSALTSAQVEEASAYFSSIEGQNRAMLAQHQ
jgi:hypothetical protein